MTDSILFTKSKAFALRIVRLHQASYRKRENCVVKIAWKFLTIRPKIFGWAFTPYWLF